jgi:histidinol-phosphate/aromatic aminotransferase/cobyric acid decarboxylase-like protein
VQTGRDIVVTVKSPEETGRDYAETSIRIKPNTCPVSANPDTVEKIKQHPNITELYPEPSYDELKIHLQTYLGQSDDTEELSYNTPKIENSSPRERDNR